MAKFPQARPPAAEQENPYLPPGPSALTSEQFNGIRTDASRAGIKDEEMYWCDGFMPIGPQNLRTLYGIGTKIFTTPASTSLVYFDFGNIGSTPYLFAFPSDGSIYAANMNTGVSTKIANAATITTPTRSNIGVSQWGSKYVIIVANQTNGYWLWDGTLLYGPGTLAPVVTITNVGSGYTTATASVLGGSGSGATFTVTVAGGVVTGVTITNPGSGWAAGDTVTMTIAGTHSVLATATVTLMPFAVGGTAVETYSGRVWIAKAATVTYSSPGSVYDFSSANGGGNFTSNDSFLRVGFTELKQTNGFLYLIADCSINYISGVSTSSSPPVTSFTNQNADPEIGTTWGGSLNVFSRNIVFANTFGVHVSYGAAVTKVSDALDGIYNTATLGSFVPSAAKAILFGKKVWMLLLPIIDPISGTQVNKLLMWDGKKWWATSQDITLQYITTQEWASNLTAYGTDGSSVYPLLTTPSTAFTKTMQSKLWSAGSIALTKAATRLWNLVQFIGTGSPTINVSVDNERGVSTQSVSFGPTSVVWTTVGGSVMTWTTVGGSPMTWLLPGITAVDPEAVQQVGVLLGLTTSTNANDVIIISQALQPEVAQYRG